MGVSLAALGSGYYALRYRFGATLRSALPNGMLRSPHASSFLIFYFISIYEFALPCLMLILNYLQG
ncbi:MAG: hypothetical protein NZ455_12100 [Bacteroidia bacterium]|nr:hypothetical protein [Bacteroidia bacterium]MDW8347187.1 hypothetical protein [Bacteroidia bacterium]